MSLEGTRRSTPGLEWDLPSLRDDSMYERGISSLRGPKPGLGIFPDIEGPFQVRKLIVCWEGEDWSGLVSGLV